MWKKEPETERQSLNALEQVLIQKRLIKHRLVEERIAKVENGDDRDKISRTVRAYNFYFILQYTELKSKPTNSWKITRWEQIAFVGHA